MAAASLASPSLPGFDLMQWGYIESTTADVPWSTVPHQVHRSSAGRPWRGLSVWHQIGPPGDLYVPPLGQHSILLRRANPTALLQRQGSQIGQGPWVPGESVVVPAGLPSFWRSAAARDNIHVNLDPAWLERAAPGAGALRSSFGRHDPLLAAMAHALLASLDSNSSLQPAFGEHMAMALAMHLVEHYAVARPEHHGALGRQRSDQITAAIAAAPGEPWPLARLAELAGLSPFHFARAFKASFGMTPHQYVCTQRMEAAARRIRGSRLPLAEIGLDCGFRSAAHFAQCFKRHWGQTPTAYRRGC